MTTIVVAAGLCSAIRPKLLTALPPEQYPSVRITAWGEGHWHIPCPDMTVFPDSDIWVKRHIARIEVNGDITFAKWCEYVICRLIATEAGKEKSQQTGYLYLMSKPLEPRNERWAAKWDTLPAPGDWKQGGCKNVIPKQKGAKQAPPAKAKKAAKPAKPAARSTRRNSILDFLRRI